MSILLLVFSTIIADEEMIITPEFAEYHIKAAVAEIEDNDIFNLIQANIDNLKNVSAAKDATNELIFLVQEGYKIDSYNMSKLIETLTWMPASTYAANVLVKAIQYNSQITLEHMTKLIKTLDHVSATDNATTVILKAIEQGVPFGLKERCLLAEMSTMISAKKNVERIRAALHLREINK